MILLFAVGGEGSIAVEGHASSQVLHDVAVACLVQGTVAVVLNGVAVGSMKLAVNVNLTSCKLSHLSGVQLCEVQLIDVIAQVGHIIHGVFLHCSVSIHIGVGYLEGNNIQRAGVVCKVHLVNHSDSGEHVNVLAGELNECALRDLGGLCHVNGIVCISILIQLCTLCIVS